MCVTMFQIMFLLEAVKNLGPLDSWPSYILRYLFVERAVPEHVKLLCAFFYGNGLPCFLPLLKCFLCTNPHATYTICPTENH